MSKFTKTLIASALAVAVAGPVSADVPDGPLSAYTGAKTTVKIVPNGCRNVVEKNVQTLVGFGNLDPFLEGEVGFGLPFAGCWVAAGFDFLDVNTLGGLRIAKKVDKKTLNAKELTMSLTSESLLDGIIDEMFEYLAFDEDGAKCNLDALDGDASLIANAYVKKGQGKFSKNQEKLKIDIQVDSKYKNDKGKLKPIKASVKGKLELTTTENPAFDCGLIVIDPLPSAL